MKDDKTYFDKIAEGYEQLETGLTPVRHYCEAYTALKLVQPLEDKSVLELACSDGYFSRLLKKGGAHSLRGIDLSPNMIDLARAEEAHDPLGIDYQVGNVLEMGVIGEFDLVYSSFVLSYAKDRLEMLDMCRVFYQNVKPGGRLISMNDNPALLPDSVTGFAKYGKTKRVTPGLEDGATITVTWENLNDKGEREDFSFDCKYYSRETLEWALTEAGFTDVCLHQPEVSPEGMAKFGENYWELFLQHPLLVFITCHKEATPQG